MKEKVFNIKLSGKTVMLIAGGLAIAGTFFGLGRLSKKSSKKELHEMAEQPKPAQEQPQAPAAAAPQPQA
jgi:hypothetical protein